jgi:hypothetical protein
MASTMKPTAIAGPLMVRDRRTGLRWRRGTLDIPEINGVDIIPGLSWFIPS